jgi:hypothetical protein
MDFDPIRFLEIEVSGAEEAQVREWLYEDMAKFMIEEFLGALSDENFEKYYQELGKVDNYEALIEIMKKYCPDLEDKKAESLGRYKECFNYSEFRKIYGD